MKKGKENHLSTELHMWCLEREKLLHAKKSENDKQSSDAGLMIIMNALMCFQKAWSAEDFVALNDKDSLNEKLKTATKNDSTAEFFQLRNLAFEILSENVKEFFKFVKFFSCTLDKVTVNRTLYIVLITYFFWKGKIHIVLNKLVKLTSDYDAEGTAEMVVSTLCETLGLTRTEVSLKLVHFVHDGVYNDAEQRIRGGGSLELVKHVCKILGLNPRSITGDHDKSHLM